MNEEVKIQPIDEVFFNLDTANNHQQIAALVLLRGEPSFAALQADVEALLPNFPKLKQRVVEGWWRDAADFSIDDHVVLRQDVSISSEEELYKRASAEFSRPLNLDKPLWRFTMIKGQTCEGESTSAVLFSYHHALTDGVGGLELIKLLFSKDAQSRPKLKVVKRERRNRAEREQNSYEGINWKLSFNHWFKELFSGKVASPLNGKNSRQRVVHGLNLPWEYFKTVRSSTGASANDIVLCTVSEAIRRYERARNISLHNARVIMPVSLRKISQRYDFGNKLTAVGLPLPVNEQSLEARLAQIKQNAKELKESGVIGAYAHLARFVSRFPAFMQRIVCEIQARRTNFIVTNMPGVKRQSYLAKAQVQQYHGLAALMKGHGVAFGFIRYADSLSAAVVCDPAIVDDPRSLATSLKEALEELVSHTQSVAERPQEQIEQMAV